MEGLELDKREGGIILRGKVLEFNLDTDQRCFYIRRRDDRIRFGPLIMHCRLERSGKRPLEILPPILKMSEPEFNDRVETPLGPAGLLSMEVLGDLPFRMIQEFAFFPENEFILARLKIQNLDSGPVRVFELVPLAYRGAGDGSEGSVGLEMGTGYGSWSFYRTGYQSWSVAGTKKILDHDYAPRFFFPRVVGANPRTSYSSRPGIKATDWMAQVVEPYLNLSLLLGFVTSARMLGRVELEVKYDRFRRLEAISDGDGIRLDPGKDLSSEWALISLSLDPLSAQKTFYRLWGQAMNARKGRPLKGWCSWYYYYGNITEQKFKDNLKECEAKLKGELDLFQLDDGYEKRPGEWLDWNKKFPSAPDQIVDKIHQAGFKAGVWMAPFVMSRTAPLARSHPEWILRKESGRPVFAFFHPRWRGRIMYALDCTHPGVKDWLKHTVDTVVHQYGFDFLKLDFIYAAALPGKRYDPYSTGAMAFRQGLEAIREAAGNDVEILGCGAPLGPSIGLVDAMRTSPDVDIHWRYPGMDMLMGWPLTPSAKNCFRNNLARSLMHGNLWCNDPDCLVLRDVKRGMNIREIQSEVTLFYLLGGYLLLSEDLRLLPRDKLDLLFKMIPLSEGTAEPLDMFLADFPEVFFQKGAPRSLLALFNWSDKARLMKLELKKLGFSGPHHVFEFWSRRYLGQTQGTMDLGMVPPHSCKYLALTRASAEKQPQMLGLDFHLGMGTPGLERFEVRAGKEIDLALNLPGKRKGSLWVSKPEGPGVQEVKVEFENSLEMRIKL